MEVLKQIQIILYFLIILFLFPIFFIFLLIPLSILREFVKICTKFAGLKEVQIIEGTNSTFAVDKIYTSPTSNLLVSLYLDGETDLDLFKSRFISNVIEKQKPCGKLQYPELRKYVKEFMGYSFWILSETFNSSNHFKLYKTDEIIDEAALEKLRDKILLKPWPAKQPLWEFIMIENFQRQQQIGVNVEESCEKQKQTPVLLFNAHHSLLDGYSILTILVEEMGNLDLDKVIAKPAISLRKLDNRKQNFNFGNFCKILSFSLSILYGFSKDLTEKVNVNSWNKFNHNDSITRYYAFDDTISMKYIRKISRSYRVSFTSVLLACVCGGIRRGMELNSEAVPDFIDCCLVLPAMENSKMLKNHLTFGFVRLPIGDDDPMRKLLEIEFRLQKLKNSIFPMLYFYMFNIVGHLPRWLINKISMANPILARATTSLINFPGPNEIWKINTTAIHSLKVQVGPMTRTGLLYSCHTYNGRVFLAAALNSQIKNSEKISENIIKFFQEELDLLI